MRNTKEFIDLMNQFEKDIKKSSIYVTDLSRTNREDGLPNDFYNNGNTNNLFKVYMLGYSFSKSVNR